MVRTTALNLVLLLAGMIFVSPGFICVSSVDAQDVVIICNKSVSETELKDSVIREIFLGFKTKWDDKTKITIITSSNRDLNKKFIPKYTGKTLNQFKMWWRKKLFTGEGKTPKSFESDEKVIQYVSIVKGAIGYISAVKLPSGVVEIKLNE